MSIPTHWRDGLEALTDQERDRIVAEQIARADSPATLEALADVHTEARAALRQEGNFELFVLTAGAAALRGWQVSEAIELHRQLLRYEQETGKLLSALRRFLLSQQVNALHV